MYSSSADNLSIRQLEQESFDSNTQIQVLIFGTSVKFKFHRPSVKFNKNKKTDGAVWRYTHCTYVQYVLVRYKCACYSEPLIIIRDGPS